MVAGKKGAADVGFLTILIVRKSERWGWGGEGLALGFSADHLASRIKSEVINRRDKRVEGERIDKK